MEKLTKRKQQAIDSKKKIYQTALLLMEKKSFERISVEEISRKAGVSTGAFYHHFSSKDDILIELFKEADVFFVQKVVNSIKGENAKDKILSYFEHFSNFYLQYGVDILKALYATQNGLFVQNDRVIVTLLQDIVNQGIEKGELKSEMTNEEIVDMLFCTVRGVAYKWCVANGDFSLQEIIVKYVRIILKAL